jgi:hypothetical protein
VRPVFCHFAGLRAFENRNTNGVRTIRVSNMSPCQVPRTVDPKMQNSENQLSTGMTMSTRDVAWRGV